MTARWMVALALAVGLGAVPARAAVHVDQDEVIFTLRMPDATDVYLVGDFNQWNPTVERMNKVDDHFEIGLFLVAGDYHYQFVVDGKSINDPDNPAVGGQRGSPLRLTEVGNSLVMSTELPGTDESAARAEVGLRYIGAMRSRDDTEDAHRFDLTVHGTFDRLSARAAVATEDTSWSASPLSIDTWFDRGRVDIDLGNVKATGFENDSIWVSSDPTALVGRAGVYDYDAGFRRHGVSGVLSSSFLALRGLYADATTRAPAEPATVVTAPGVIAYAARPSFDGSDVLAAEAELSFKGGGAGIVIRRETGANPGVLAAVSSSPEDVVYATHENRAVSTLWARHDNLFGVRLTGGYGWGGVKAHASASGADSIETGDTVDATAAVNEIDQTYPVLKTNRILAGLAAGDETRLHGSVRWDFTRFDFDGLRGDSRADVQRVTLRAAHTLDNWAVALRALYTDADYGESPDALAIDWPELNPWLSIWDEYDAPAIVGLAFDRYDVATLSVARAWSRVAGRIDATAAMQDVVGEIVHGSVRAHADAAITGPWHATIDARAAWYDGAAWTSNGTLWSGYVEGSYRRGGVELSAGFGFDPLVFDRVLSEYADIGTTEFLRGALAGGVTRSRADDIVRSLIERERALEDAAVFKLELVVDLR